MAPESWSSRRDHGLPGGPNRRARRRSRTTTGTSILTDPRRRCSSRAEGLRRYRHAAVAFRQERAAGRRPRHPDRTSAVFDPPAAARPVDQPRSGGRCVGECACARDATALLPSCAGRQPTVRTKAHRARAGGSAAPLLCAGPVRRHRRRGCCRLWPAAEPAPAAADSPARGSAMFPGPRPSPRSSLERVRADDACRGNGGGIGLVGKRSTKERESIHDLIGRSRRQGRWSSSTPTLPLVRDELDPRRLLRLFEQHAQALVARWGQAQGLSPLGRGKPEAATPSVAERRPALLLAAGSAAGAAECPARCGYPDEYYFLAPSSRPGSVGFDRGRRGDVVWFQPTTPLTAMNFRAARSQGRARSDVVGGREPNAGSAVARM